MPTRAQYQPPNVTLPHVPILIHRSTVLHTFSIHPLIPIFPLPEPTRCQIPKFNLIRPFTPSPQIQRSTSLLHKQHQHTLHTISPFSNSDTRRLSAQQLSPLSPIMSLKASQVIALLNRNGDGLNSAPSAQVLKVFTPANSRLGLVTAASKNSQSRPLSGVVFEPFEEVKKELSLVPTVPQESLARHKYSVECEAAVNEQINVEYNVSYVYHAMYAYFDRDNVGLKGLARFFKESSEEEREHAEIFMEYQNKRGGKVKLQSILMPVSEYDHAEKGDALYAMELALSLEKLTNEKLLHLHKVATQNNDAQLTNFVESEFLTEQVESIKRISEYVAQLRRVGKGHGVWHFDQMLLDEGAAA